MLTVDPDSSVGIATPHRLDGPRFQSRWRRDFPYPSRPAPGPAQPPTKWVSGLFLGVEWLGSGVNHPLLSSDEVKERVDLYLYSPSVPSRPGLGRTLFSLPSALVTYVGTDPS